MCAVFLPKVAQGATGGERLWDPPNSWEITLQTRLELSTVGFNSNRLLAFFPSGTLELTATLGAMDREELSVVTSEYLEESEATGPAEDASDSEDRSQRSERRSQARHDLRVANADQSSYMVSFWIVFFSYYFFQGDML